MRKWLLFVIGLVQGAVGVSAQQPIPLGSEFQVNTYTTKIQSRASVSADGQGTFIVAWESTGSFGDDSSERSIQARRFLVTGLPVSAEFQVNSYTTDSQYRPAIAADVDGNFVAAWISQGSYGTDNSESSIQLQRFDPTDTPVNGEIQVNTYTANLQWLPAVAFDRQGELVVAWQSMGSSGSDRDWSIQGQRFDEHGSATGVEFQVNSYTSGHQDWAAVSSDGDGNFVVVWESLGSPGTDTSGWSVQGQRFDFDGALDGDQFQVNSYTYAHQQLPDVAVDSQGNFVVVWESSVSPGTDVDSGSIQGQRFDSSGTAVGDQFQVNDFTPGGQVRPAVAVDGLGRFLVAWESFGSPGSDASGRSIQAQLFDSTGARLGGQFQVNSYTLGNQSFPDVTFDVLGNVIVVWESNGSFGTDSSQLSVQAQRFAVPFFSDGFESDDTSAWSMSSP